MIASICGILFLIFGWIYKVKGLVIFTLASCTFWLIVSFVLLGLGAKALKGSKLIMSINALCICLSIICLCIKF